MDPKRYPRDIVFVAIGIGTGCEGQLGFRVEQRPLIPTLSTLRLAGGCSGKPVVRDPLRARSRSS